MRKLSPESDKLSEYIEKRPDYGQRIHITASFRRHAIPDKDPESGMSLDKLAPAGVEQAKNIGKGVGEGAGQQDKKIKVFASGKSRAKETGQNIMGEAAEQAEIINQNLGDGKYEIKGKQELETITLGNEAKRLVKEKGYNGFIEEWLNRKDLSDGSTTPEQAATGLASRVDLYRRMSKLLKNDSDVLIENITHGPSPDAFIAEVAQVKDKDGKALEGYEKIKELGGVFQPSDNFEINMERTTPDQEPTLSLSFRGGKLDIDQERFNELVAKYEEWK